MRKIKFLTLLLILPLIGFSQSGKSSTKYVYISEIPKPKYPAIIKIDQVEFLDAKDSKNNVLDAKESAEVKYRLTNSGKGDAYKLVLNISQSKGTKGVRYNRKVNLADLKSGESKIFSIPVIASKDISSGDFELLLLITEGNGFDSDSTFVNFKTQEFRAPNVRVLEGDLVSEGENALLPGTSARLNLLIQNIGQGIANNVKIEFKLPAENVYPTDKEVFVFDSLSVNDHKKISFGFMLNKRFTEEKLKIDVIVTEKLGEYGHQKTFTFQLGHQMAAASVFNVNGTLAQNIEITKQTLTSDVDVNIPKTSKEYKNKVALIIGNENYSANQTSLNSEVDVAFAKADAKVFRDYCIKTLGVMPVNIVYRENGTAAQMAGDILKIKQLINLLGQETEVIVYYAGHGLPKESTNEAFLIPVDVEGTNISAGIKLSYLYEQLTEFKSNRVTVFLDACFTGGARGQGLIAARGIRVKPKNDYLRGNIVVFSASSATESSMPWTSKNHGLFTYFLLKKVQESKGNVDYSQLYEYLKKNVALESIRVNSKNQTPQILTSPEVGDEWKKWKL